MVYVMEAQLQLEENYQCNSRPHISSKLHVVQDCAVIKVHNYISMLLGNTIGQQ